jgi:Domain of unknown function (DUF4070)/Radical SAM superfamily
MAPRMTKVLMIYPRFNADSFWVYTAACEIVGARYPTAPLGLITVAALLPSSWPVRLVNRNTEELSDSDIEWADLVMTGGMLFQQDDTLGIIKTCHARGKPVVVGGPDVTSHPHMYTTADFQVLGEAEGIMDEFIKAWESGDRKGVFEAPRNTIDVTKTPIPRFDLLKFDHYLYIGVQFSRGCPFTCEFCDIIELYGRTPRAKTNSQMLAELEALYQLGYRGHVDFVDDNLIGNKKAVKGFLPHLKAWLDKHDYPFEFTTEASINLADDAELLRLMSAANFFGVFVGIESPDTETLIQMRKKQNTRRNIAQSIHTIYASGMFVTAGFIVGFDSEKGSVAEPMIDLIEEAAIPVSMVGLLYAMSNTQLGRRLAKEGRLYAGHEMQTKEAGDYCAQGLNFETLRPRRDILLDYKRVLETIYDPAMFTGRLKHLSDMLDRSKSRRDGPTHDVKRKFSALEGVHRIINHRPDLRELLWKTFTHCASTNPRALRFIVMLMAMYLHLGPYSRLVIEEIERRLASPGAEAAGSGRPSVAAVA